MNASTYELIRSMTEGFEQTIQSAKELRQVRLIPKDSLRSIVVGLQEARAGANADLSEKISERERAGHTRFGRQRRAHEKRLENSDDVYFDVLQRETNSRRWTSLREHLFYRGTLGDDGESIRAANRRYS
jgi:hypothetical protein